jgi:hypothetical protein
VPWPPAEGIEEAFGRQEACYSYFEASVPSILKAVDDLVDFLDAEGPFDGVIGFSQGGALATTLMAAEERGVLKPPGDAMQAGAGEHQRRIPCAILMSCGLPWDYAALQAGESRRLTPDVDGCCIRVPTAHFWGSNDASGHPGNGEVTLLCDEESRVELVHTAGHGVPSGSRPQELEGMVAAIEKTVQRAVFANQ